MPLIEQIQGFRETVGSKVITASESELTSPQIIELLSHARHYFVGDIHGAPEALQLLRIMQSAPFSQTANVLLLGDYFDRGVLTPQMPKLLPREIFTGSRMGLLGNHDLKIGIDNDECAKYDIGGGQQAPWSITFYQEFVASRTWVQSMMKSRQLLGAMVVDDHLLTHASFNPKILDDTLIEIIREHHDPTVKNMTELLQLIADHENERRAHLSELTADYMAARYKGRQLIGMSAEQHHLENFLHHFQFNIGADRGGDGIGGIYWNSFATTLCMTDHNRRALTDPATLPISFPCTLSNFLTHPLHFSMIHQICAHTPTDELVQGAPFSFYGPVAYNHGQLVCADGAFFKGRISLLVMGEDRQLYSVILTGDKDTPTMRAFCLA